MIATSYRLAEWSTRVRLPHCKPLYFQRFRGFDNGFTDLQPFVSQKDW